jgi:hypothetical protein
MATAGCRLFDLPLADLRREDEGMTRLLMDGRTDGEGKQPCWPAVRHPRRACTHSTGCTASARRAPSAEAALLQRPSRVERWQLTRVLGLPGIVLVSNMHDENFCVFVNVIIDARRRCSSAFASYGCGNLRALARTPVTQDGWMN